uniref:Uncharacterized protein n=1 Tax=Picea glauca TaxID=3330 RepID=A0A101M5C6_PICGL|nr:hypothetical protein ABT39_MTgene1008 [Picea glauca]
MLPPLLLMVMLLRPGQQKLELLLKLAWAATLVASYG